MNDTSLKALEKQIISIAQEVGKLIKEKRKTFNAEQLEEKSANNLVTVVDKAAEAFLLDKLSKAFPGSGFMGEEGGDISSENGYRWIVDPIDGTSNFVHDLPLYSTSIALEKDNEIVLGVINDIPHDTVYHAVQGMGAYANGKQISVSGTKTVYHSLFVTGFPYEESELDRFLGIYKHLLRNSRGVRRFGSAAIDLCYVAAGKFEAFYEVGLNPWDVAAGGLLVKEAGGAVTTITNTNDWLFGKSLCASNGQIHSELLALM